MVAHAVLVNPARAAIEASGAGASAIDVGFSAIEDLVVASRGLTGVCGANVALAIEVVFARAAVGADGTIRATAIDAGFEAIRNRVHTCGGITYACCT